MAIATPEPSGREILKKFGKEILGRQRTLIVGAVIMAIPAAWITKVHMGWKHSPDAKKRMLIAQATFWTSMLLGFKVLHAALFTLPDRKVLMPQGFLRLLSQLGKRSTQGPAAAKLAVIAGGLGGFIGSMIGGFSGGAALGKKIVPKAPRNYQPNPTPTLNQVSPAPVFSLPSGSPSVGGNFFTVSKPYSYNTYPLPQVSMR
jgi:hypothetical protein